MRLLDVFLVAEAWAAGGAEPHEADLSGIIFPLLNFLIYVGIIYFFAFPAVRRFLQSRREQVVATMTAAAARKQQAAALVEDYRHRLANIENESRAIGDSLKAEGERDKARLIREAEGLAAKIISDARFLADQEAKVARQQVLGEIAEKARALATDLVRTHISPSDQERLVQEFTHDVGQVR
jgi:F-type H+-transporting ATPase subunit b